MRGEGNVREGRKKGEGRRDGRDGRDGRNETEETTREKGDRGKDGGAGNLGVKFVEVGLEHRVDRREGEGVAREEQVPGVGLVRLGLRRRALMPLEQV